MSVHDPLLVFAWVGIPVGLLAGALLGPVANRTNGWGGYASFRRRAARLAHVAAVVLPLIGGFYASSLGWSPAEHGPSLLARWAWIGGSVAMVALLLLAAWRPRWRFGLPLPATALLTASIAFAFDLLTP